MGALPKHMHCQLWRHVSMHENPPGMNDMTMPARGPGIEADVLKDTHHRALQTTPSTHAPADAGQQLAGRAAVAPALAAPVHTERLAAAPTLADDDASAVAAGFAAPAGGGDERTRR